MAGDFFANILTFDSKIVRTLLPLFFIPGTLTKEYLEGKRNLYYTPARLFLVSMTIAFIFLNFFVSKIFSTNEDLETNLELRLQIREDSLQKVLYATFPDSIDQQKITTIFQDSIVEDKGDDRIFFSLNGDTAAIGITEKDMFLLSEEELIEKYKITSFWQKQLVCQMAKSIKSPQGFQLYLIGHLSWFVLLSIPLIGLILKLLYIRSKRTYVEHSVFVLHFHTFVFVMCSFLLAWLLWQEDDYDMNNAILLTVFICILYFIISLKRVYAQSVFKTLFKIFLFSIGYFFVILIAFILFMGWSFLVY